MRLRSIIVPLIAFAALLMIGAASLLHARHSMVTGHWLGHEVDGLHYEVLLPERYDPGRAYPVVLYLHQLDAGTDREGLRRQVDGWFSAAAFRAAHPCIVVVPMLDQKDDPGGVTINFGGKRTGGFGEAQTIAALRQVMQAYRVDRERVYVTGNSMGGMGTWNMLLAYNAVDGQRDRIFAAGMPLAGTHRTADPGEAAKILARVPVWAIHGADDREISPDWDRTMARLLAGSPSFRYTEAPGLRHDVWDTFYARQDVWDWLFAQNGKPL